MDEFIPYEKLSKKKKRQLDAEKRGSWYGINPITRKSKNPKAYDRKKARCWQDDSSDVLSSCIQINGLEKALIIKISLAGAQESSQNAEQPPRNNAPRRPRGRTEYPQTR